MPELVVPPSNAAAPCAGRALPLLAPLAGLTIRPGVLEDVPFLDALQKRHATAVG